MRVMDIMTSSPISVGLDDNLATIKQIFDSHGFHHLLVVAEDELFGIISDRDVLRAISPFVDSVSERAIDAATMKRHAHQIMTRSEEHTSELQSLMRLSYAVFCLKQ